MRVGELVTDGPRLRRGGLGSKIAPPLVATALGISGLAIAAYLASGRSLIPLGLPFAIVGAYVAARQPMVAIGAIFVLTGFQGTLTASTRVPVNEAINVVLAALWLGVLARVISGRRNRATWFWPGLIGLSFYLVLTVVALLTTTDTDAAIESFRTSAWFMSIALVIALAPWSRQTYVRAARAMVLAALAVGLYSIYRYAFGPSAAEEILARASARQIGLPGSTELRFYGSFAVAQNLAAWTAILVPFTFAVTLGERGRWRMIGLTATTACAFAMLVSEIRTGLVAGVIGAIVVAILFAGAPAFPSGRRIAAPLAAGLVALIAGAVVYTSTVGESQESSARYERLVTDPGNDAAYSARLTRWTATLDVADDEPFGHGLGTQGAVGAKSQTGVVGAPNLDSSYLKVAVEQGLFVMALLIAALVSLLIGLVLYARRATSPAAAMLAIAGGGALASAMVLFYAGTFIEGITAVPIWVAVGIGAAQPCTAPARARAAARSR